MSQDSTYYMGLLQLGKEPDFERAAKSIDLMRANGLHVVPRHALKVDGEYLLPFCTRSSVRPVGPSVEPRRMIKDLCPYDLRGYKEINPKVADARTLEDLVMLASDNSTEVYSSPTRPDDLRPLHHRVKEPMDCFEGLIGLEAQRDLLMKIANLCAKHGTSMIESRHMIFFGEPGTGKTELASRFLAYSDALGLTDGSGNFVKVCGSEMIAGYVGHTAPKVRSFVTKARGGVLFIDEAYSLMDGSSFGQEAIDTLVDLLDSERANFICIMAGYPEQMEALMAANPGLRDRFGFRIRFDSYSDDELMRIWGTFAAKKGFKLEEGYEVEIEAALRKCVRELKECEGFANARTMRRLFDRAMLESAMRTDRKRISAADLLGACTQDDMGARPKRKRVGF